MDIRTGIDIVFIPRFSQSIEMHGNSFTAKIFTESERELTTESLAGIFAAKEAVIKALSLSPNRWHEIEIAHTTEGRPYLASYPGPTPTSTDLSISHQGEYAVAHTVFLFS